MSGLGQLKTSNFLVVSTTGRLLGTVILSLQGSSLREDREVFFFILLGVTALLILGGYFHVGWWLRSVIRDRRRSRPSLPAPPPERVAQPPEGGNEGKEG